MQSPKNAPAGFGTRLVAYLIDMLLVDLVILLCMFPVMLEKWAEADSIWNQEVLFDHSVYAIVVYAIRAVYLVITTYTMGATLGKKLLRIQVETADGSKLTFVNVLFRETVGRFLSGILYIGYLIALGGREHLALHDMLCDTRVCYRDLAEAVRPQVRETPNPYQPDYAQKKEYTMPQQPPQQRQEPTPIYRAPIDLQDAQQQEKYGDYVLPQMAKRTPGEMSDKASEIPSGSAEAEMSSDRSAEKAAEKAEAKPADKEEIDEEIKAVVAAAFGKTEISGKETADGDTFEGKDSETGGDAHESKGL